MTKICKDHSVWVKTTALFGLLVLVVVVMWGCSSAKGQNMAERSNVLAAMRSMGFTFDDTLLSTEYGDSTSQVVITGPFAGLPREIERSASNKNLICPYSKAVLNKLEGKWVLATVEKRSLGWWPSQSSRDICSK